MCHHSPSQMTQAPSAGGVGLARLAEVKNGALFFPMQQVLARSQAGEPGLRSRAIVMQIIVALVREDDGLACAEHIAIARPAAVL